MKHTAEAQLTDRQRQGVHEFARLGFGVVLEHRPQLRGDDKQPIVKYLARLGVHLRDFCEGGLDYAYLVRGH